MRQDQFFFFCMYCIHNESEQRELLVTKLRWCTLTQSLKLQGYTTDACTERDRCYVYNLLCVIKLCNSSN